MNIFKVNEIRTYKAATWVISGNASLGERIKLKFSAAIEANNNSPRT